MSVCRSRTRLLFVLPLVLCSLLVACATRSASVQPTTAASPPEVTPVEEEVEVAATEGPGELEAAPAEPTVAPSPTVAPPPTATATPEPSPTPTVTPEPSPTPTLPPTPVPVALAPLPRPRVPSAVPVELTRIPDTDPAPPLSILVHSIQAQDNGYTRLTGLVRNDGSETFEGVGVRASFVDREGRGAGPIEVYVPCAYLEPAATCAFVLDVYGTDMAAYRLHPQGHPVVYGQAASVSVRVLRVFTDGVGNVRITGTATNANPFAVRSVIVVGTLLDTSGQVVSTDWDLVAGDLAAGASAPFDVRIEYRPYASYTLLGQATRD